MDAVWDVVGSLIPPVFIGLLFWFIMRAILRADSKEREVYAEIEAEERAKLQAKKGTNKR
jgi:preprotein translocase subunit YajC